MTREQAKREIVSLDFYLLNHTDDYGEESHTAMMMAIKALEELPKRRKEVKRWKARAAQIASKQNGWIPVSDRLPKDGTYLVTVERIYGVPRIDIKAFAKDLNKVDECDFPKHKCGWYDYDGEYGYWEDTKVTAWMPLPEPYKVEPQESEG